jgi:hypothetical protein
MVVGSQVNGGNGLCILKGGIGCRWLCKIDILVTVDVVIVNVVCWRGHIQAVMVTTEVMYS